VRQSSRTKSLAIALLFVACVHSIVSRSIVDCEMTWSMPTVLYILLNQGVFTLTIIIAVVLYKSTQSNIIKSFDSKEVFEEKFKRYYEARLIHLFYCVSLLILLSAGVALGLVYLGLCKIDLVSSLVSFVVSSIALVFGLLFINRWYLSIADKE